MKQLIINDVTIELSDQEGVHITRGNTVMDGTDSYTLPIEISLDSQANRSAIKNMNILSVDGDRGQELSAQLLVDGIMLLDGYAVISEMDDDYVELMLKGNNLNFWKYIEDEGIMLSDLDWPEISAFSSPQYNNVVIAEINTTLTTIKDYVCFEMVNVADMDDYPNNLDMIFNRYYYDVEEFNSDFWSGFTPQNTVFLRIHAVMKYLFTAFGYTIEYNIFADDAFKNDVILNACNIFNIENEATYDKFLPNMTVYDFLDAFRQSGFDFQVDTARSIVRISQVAECLEGTPEKITNILRSGRKISPEAKNGYTFSMSDSGQYGTSSFINEDYDDADNLVDVIANNNVSQKIKIPTITTEVEGDVVFVKSEGVFYQVVDNDDTLEWERVKGLTGNLTGGNEEIEFESPISIALSETLYGSYFVQKISRQMTVVNIQDWDSCENIILSTYRGLKDSAVPDASYTTFKFPFASYINYTPSGNPISTEHALSSSLFRDILYPKIALLESSYKMEYQFSGRLEHLLKSSFPPLLIEGKKAILEQRSAKVQDQADEIIITDTVYVEQTI